MIPLTGMSDESDDSLDDLFEDLRNEIHERDTYTLICKKNSDVIARKRITKKQYLEIFNVKDDLDKNVRDADVHNGVKADIIEGDSTKRYDRVKEENVERLFTCDSESDFDEISNREPIQQKSDEMHGKDHGSVNTTPIISSESGADDRTSYYSDSSLQISLKTNYSKSKPSLNGQTKEVAKCNYFNSAEVEQLFTSDSDSSIENIVNGNNHRDAGSHVTNQKLESTEVEDSTIDSLFGTDSEVSAEDGDVANADSLHRHRLESIETFNKESTIPHSVNKLNLKTKSIIEISVTSPSHSRGKDEVKSITHRHNHNNKNNDYVGVSTSLTCNSDSSLSSEFLKPRNEIHWNFKSIYPLTSDEEALSTSKASSASDLDKADNSVPSNGKQSFAGELQIDVSSDNDICPTDDVKPLFRKKKLKSFIDEDSSLEDSDIEIAAQVNSCEQENNSTFRHTEGTVVREMEEEKEDGEISDDDNDVDVEEGNFEADNKSIKTENYFRQVEKKSRRKKVQRRKRKRMQENLYDCAKIKRMPETVNSFLHNGEQEKPDMNKEWVEKESFSEHSLLDTIGNLPEDFIICAGEYRKEDNTITEAKKKRGGKKKKSRKRNEFNREHHYRDSSTAVNEKKEERQEQKIEKPVEKPPCKFYLANKCIQGSECKFRHDGVKNEEACKFYKIGFCSKGDECVYMHSEFPCKFYHAFRNCKDAVCRFSHAPLTEKTRMLLEKDIAITAEVPEKAAEPSTVPENSDQNIVKEEKPDNGAVQLKIDLLPSLYKEI